jgi:ketosteroid isomerase-like protein
MKPRLSLLILLLAACQRGTSSDTTEVRRVIEENNARIMHWYATGQADSIASFFAHDARQMPPNMPPVVSRDSIASFWRRGFNEGKWSFDLKTQEVLSDNSLAAERGTYTLSFVAGPNAPFPSFQDRGNYVVVWRKESDGTWRAVWDAPVSTVPLPQPASGNDSQPRHSH